MWILTIKNWFISVIFKKMKHRIEEEWSVIGGNESEREGTRGLRAV